MSSWISRAPHWLSRLVYPRPQPYSAGSNLSDRQLFAGVDDFANRARWLNPIPNELYRNWKFQPLKRLGRFFIPKRFPFRKYRRPYFRPYGRRYSKRRYWRH